MLNNLKVILQYLDIYSILIKYHIYIYYFLLINLLTIIVYFVKKCNLINFFFFIAMFFNYYYVYKLASIDAIYFC